MSDGRTRAQGLGRLAAVVKAGAAGAIHFDQGYPLTVIH
jgi:hypothetical protein